MVKNFGGNKQKKQGRKFTNNRPNNALRLSECDDEMYGCITKLLGNGMANVRGIDNIERLLIIRNKFKGRGKRDNTLKPGTIVLYGDRSWETKVDNKIQKCDLLEVYSDSDYKKLQDRIALKWSSFNDIINPGPSGNSNDDNLGFSFEKHNTNSALENEINNEIGNNDNNTFIVDDEEIDIDDI